MNNYKKVKKKTFIQIIIEMIKIFIIVLSIVIIWDLITESFCVSNCNYFKSTKTFFSNLHILFPICLLIAILIEIVKEKLGT